MRNAFPAILAVMLLLLFAIAPAVAQEGPDEVEPNDDWELADSIDGLYIEGEIGARGDDDDWFVLEGQEGYNPTFTLWYDDDDCDIDVEIWSDDEIVGSLTSTSSPDSITVDVPGECWLHVYVFDGRGEYEIEIEPGRGRSDRDDRRRDDDCEGPDEWEPNDDFEDADYIDSLYIEGYACRDDKDWYVLEGQEGFNPTITIYYDDDECDIDVTVWSDDDVVGSLSSVSSPDSAEFDVPGECWLEVDGYSGEGWYEIEIEPGRGRRDSRRHDRDCEGPDEIEPNDDYEDADYIEDVDRDGTDIEGYACEDDVDWYLIDGSEGRRPYITIYYDDDDCDIDVTVWDDDEIVGSLSAVSSPDGDSFRVSGDCWLEVTAYSGEGWYEIEIDP